ncbi:F-box only protein 50 isoform X2 [Entelurus aequoreus]|uniref:F-box only protein 50 isoform X2 n=1 Tax=Entelurus aequoreus TaxID=161455 RepID=UPI002B1D68E8|nr:F-box only protein 50 isoform X2 [Entelurus aequoreus]
MTAPEWKKRCDEEWALGGMAMPDSVDWKSAYEAKPFGRNLLKNPSPHGLSKDIPPPEPEMPDAPMHSPPCFEPEGDFSGWSTNTEVLPCDTSGIPAGVVVCALPQNSWFTLEQTVDLKAEGLWEKLLDDFQPEIMIQDWYEESQLHESIYQLQVKLLGADKSSVIAEHSVKPSEDLSTYSHTWKEVSHVFSGYGPGVRYIHFLHRLKNQFMMSFYSTSFTGSSVMIKPVKTSS